jgi:hypothetical protein
VTPILKICHDNLHIICFWPRNQTLEDHVNRQPHEEEDKPWIFPQQTTLNILENWHQVPICKLNKPP